MWTFDSVLLCGSEQKIRDMVRKQSNRIPGGEKVIPDGGFDSPHLLFSLVSGKVAPISSASACEHPKVALTIFGKGNLAFTARGPARVVQESMVAAPAFAAVAIDVENIDDHRQREFAVDSGVSLDWTNERTERFLQEHLNALREVAASEE